jgi:DNA-binding transcriptional LysR family regulator
VLDLHRLRVFRSVVASGSLRASAENLGYTPSAVSQHLSALQRETGLVLFERAGRGLKPTAAGWTLAQEADELLLRMDQAETFVADLRAGRTGSLSIAYFASVGTIWMPPLVQRLKVAFPGLRLNLRLTDDPPPDPDDRADVQVAIATATFDAGSGFLAHHLVDDPYVVVLPDGHALAARSEIELAELADEDWVDNDFSQGRCRRIVLDACAAAGFCPSYLVEAHDYPSAMAFVAAGIGITVMPEIAARDLPAGVTVRPLVRPTPIRSLHVVVRDSLASTPPARLAVDLLRAIATPAPRRTSSRGA